jgi:predicted dehydrogenase
MNSIKLGLIGLGHLGKIHLRNILKIDEIELVGIYDNNAALTSEVAKDFNINAFNNVDNLIEQCEALDIVTATNAHYDIAKKCIQKGKHVFIEKPITATFEQAKEIVQLAEAYNIKAQVGHVERYNPAYLAIKEKNISPKFIEVHRLAQFNPRGNDVSVVMDLMIHDLDLLLKMTQSNIKQIEATGVSIICESADICNARIEFENGCVANVTASRMSMKNMRKMRLFQHDAYISMDFYEKKTEIITLQNWIEGEEENMLIVNGNIKKRVQLEIPQSPEINAIEYELRGFANAIIKNLDVEVSAVDGMKAMQLAEAIESKIKERNLIT